MFPYKAHSWKYEPNPIEPRKDRKQFASPGGTKTIVWNRCSYKVPVMVGTDDSINKNHKFYNSTVQAIPRGVGYYSTKVVSL